MKILLLISMIFLSALSPAQTTPDAIDPMGKVEFMALAATEPASRRIAIFLQHRGIDFTVDESFLKSLQDNGVEPSLLKELESAKAVSISSRVAKAVAAAKEAEVLEHLELAARLNRNDFHPRAAEPEFRAAVAADTANPFAHLALGKVLSHLGQIDAAESAFRTVLNTQPDLAEAHLELGKILMYDPATRSEALVELRKAAELAPYDPRAQYSYASALPHTKGGKKEAQKRRELANKLAGRGIPMRIRVGGGDGKPIFSPPPQYPAEAKATHTQGMVRLEILLGSGGAVKDLEVISGESSLAKAAAEAVAKWRYRPTLLNREPVEVITEVDVNFILD